MYILERSGHILCSSGNLRVDDILSRESSVIMKNIPQSYVAAGESFYFSPPPLSARLVIEQIGQ